MFSVSAYLRKPHREEGQGSHRIRIGLWDRREQKETIVGIRLFATRTLQFAHIPWLGSACSWPPCGRYLNFEIPSSVHPWVPDGRWIEQVRSRSGVDWVSESLCHPQGLNKSSGPTGRHAGCRTARRRCSPARARRRVSSSRQRGRPRRFIAA